MEENELSLPADTLKILNEFLQEKAQREHEENERIQNKAGKEAKFEENWQLSQFWYSDATKQALGQVTAKLVQQQETLQKDYNYSIALLSCPSLYATVKAIHDNVKIFEFDQRFSAYGDDFVLYDFNNADAEDYLKEHYNGFDLIIADPPFLSEECISKMGKIIKNLQRPNAKIIFCSGAVVEHWLVQYLQLTKCNFEPKHERNLGNEFVSYANFSLDDCIASDLS